MQVNCTFGQHSRLALTEFNGRPTLEVVPQAMPKRNTDFNQENGGRQDGAQKKQEVRVFAVITIFC